MSKNKPCLDAVILQVSTVAQSAMGESQQLVDAHVQGLDLGQGQTLATVLEAAEGAVGLQQLAQPLEAAEALLADTFAVGLATAAAVCGGGTAAG